ncbi:MAG: hypothetical protein BWX70_00962 [Verrucomicrobia bacterium ADurb.Bin070]|nr:MAG: hypothetical protein BWX70_00962 [Verrucomicrobia bacterium ADurb.Bin070]
MYTTDIHYRKVFAALLFGIVCVSAAYASPCPNCSKWEGQTFHDAQVTKGGRCKMGTIPKEVSKPKTSLTGARKSFS